MEKLNAKTGKSMENFLKLLILMKCCISFERYYCVEYEYEICFGIYEICRNVNE